MEKAVEKFYCEPNNKINLSLHEADGEELTIAEME